MSKGICLSCLYENGIPGSRSRNRGRDRERRGGVNLRMSFLGGMMLGVAVCSNAGTSVSKDTTCGMATVIG